MIVVSDTSPINYLLLLNYKEQTSVIPGTLSNLYYTTNCVYLPGI